MSTTRDSTTQLCPTSAAFNLSFRHARQRVYEENHDAQKWLHNASVLEKWLAERENHLAEDWRQAENVDQVEDLIRE